MAIIPIYNCFHPILKQKANKITEITNKIRTLIDNMFDLLKIQKMELV
jgi:peptide deformylase